MKILNVNHIIDPVSGGGTAERTFQMSQQLIQHGEDCTILTLVDSAQKRTLKGGRIVVLPVISRRFLIPKKLWLGISQHVRESDVVHLMGHWTLLNAFVYIIAKSLKKPYVFCPAGALPIVGRSCLLKKMYNFLIGRRIVRDAAKWIAITEAEKQHFTEYGVNPSDVVLIPNAIEVPQAPKKEDNTFAAKFEVGKRPFVLFLGRLSFIKGPDILISAFCSLLEKVKDLDLVVAGPDDSMLKDLKQLVQKYKAEDRVHFVGFVGGSDKVQAYQAAKILAIPSRQEAMSLVVLEAAAVGTPSVFTDQCGLDNFAKDGCGWMVPATVEGLSRGLETALKDVAQIDLMGSRVFEYVQKHYSWPAVIKIYQEMYRNLLKSRS